MSYRISVITPSLNSAKYIEGAIKSVLDQNYDNSEHIIVDAVSTDCTIEILKKYPHLKWISERDNGQSDAMNKGFKMSTGDIIVCLNADDYFLPDAFKTVLPYFEKGAQFVVGKVKVVMEDGQSWINDPRVKHEEILKHWEPEAFCVNPVGYFYLREVQESVGGFNVDNNIAMDLEFLIAASQKYTFTKIDALLGVYRFLEGTKTVELQKTPDYWTVKNLFFIEKYLKNLQDDFLKKYKLEREKGYKIRQLEPITLNVKKALRSKKFLSASYWELLLFIYHPDRKKLIIDKLKTLLIALKSRMF